MTDTAVTTRDNRPPIVVLRERLEAREGELRNSLTDVDPKHFIRAVVTAAQINPDLQACSFQSLWLACMRACRDGLLPDGREGAIVPYKSNAQWIPMYQGLLKKFRASGQCKWIGSDVVREGETFEHWVDQTGEHFKHIPGDDGTKPITKVYAAALTKDSGFYVAVMSMADIQKIKNMSRASRDDSPWKVWPEEMMKKTVLRRLSKLLPAGRDFFDDDDEQPMQQQPATVYTINEARAAGAAGALDQFAGGGGAVERTAEAGEPDGPTGNEGIGGPSDPISSGLQDHLSIAYERGKIAKQTGAQRRSMPGEYREEANVAEANAWLAGYDGKSNPADSTGSSDGGQDSA
jgi:recombination protein RecT